MKNDYVLDVTLSTPCFCPYENGKVITGLSFIGGIPDGGKCIGIFHEGGSEALKSWIEQNPNWREEYLK